MAKPIGYHIVLSEESFCRIEIYKNDILAGNVRGRIVIDVSQ